MFSSDRTTEVGASPAPAEGRRRPGARGSGTRLGSALATMLAVAGLVACARDALVPSPVETPDLDGAYALVLEESFRSTRRQLSAEVDDARRRQGEELLRRLADGYADFRIGHGVIRSGTLPVQEFSLQEARVEGDTLRGRAIWHEDAGDPGDSREVELILRREARRSSSRWCATRASPTRSSRSAG